MVSDRAAKSLAISCVIECLAELPNFLEFPGWWSIIFSNEVTLGVVGSGWGWSPGRPGHDWKLGTFSSTPHSLERGEGLEMEVIIDQARMMKPS